MNAKKRSAFFLMLPFAIYTGTANSAAILEEMTLHTMLESTASVFTTLGDYSVLNPDGITDGTANISGSGISWTGSYSNSGWTYTGTGSFGGTLLSMNYSGALSGSDGSDITVSIAGTGFLGSQPLFMNGSTQWFYDTATNDYLAMTFAQETKIGANSWWGWVVGTELILGVGAGVVSGLVAGGAITVGTGGSGAPVGVAAGVKAGVVVGAAATVATTAISAAVKTTLAEDQHAAALPPAKPSDSDLFSPLNQGTLVADNGALYADDMNSLYRSTGSYATGAFSGTTISVPEPATAWLICGGLFGLLATRKKIIKFPVAQV